MQGVQNMQLLIILALLLFGGKSGNILSEVKPILENVGGDEMREALKNAEQISSVLSAVQAFAPQGGAEVGKEEFIYKPEGFPLAPIASLADRDITYSLSKYIAQN